MMMMITRRVRARMIARDDVQHLRALLPDNIMISRGILLPVMIYAADDGSAHSMLHAT